MSLPIQVRRLPHGANLPLPTYATAGRSWDGPARRRRCAGCGGSAGPRADSDRPRRRPAARPRAADPPALGSRACATASCCPTAQARSTRTTEARCRSSCSTWAMRAVRGGARHADRAGRAGPRHPRRLGGGRRPGRHQRGAPAGLAAPDSEVNDPCQLRLDPMPWFCCHTTARSRATTGSRFSCLTSWSSACATRASSCSLLNPCPKAIPTRSQTGSATTVLDAFLAADPYARVACETLVTTNRVVLAGETRGPDTITPEHLEAPGAHGHPRYRLRPGRLFLARRPRSSATCTPSPPTSPRASTPRATRTRARATRASCSAMPAARRRN